MDIHYLDLIIAIPLIWGLYKGFTRGLIFEASSLVALSAGIWAGTHFSDYCAQLIKDRLQWESEYLPIISFAIVFIAMVVLINLAARILKKLADGLALGGIDKLLGAVLGSMKFGLIISVIMFIFNALTVSYPLLSFDVKKESVLYEPVSKIAPLIIPALKEQTLIK